MGVYFQAMSIKNFISLLFTVAISVNTMATGTLTQEEAYNHAQTWVDSKNNTEFDLMVNQEKYIAITNEDVIVAYLFEVLPQGFITISSSNIKNPVIAYSFNHNFIGENSKDKIVAHGLIRHIGYGDFINSNSGHLKTFGKKMSITTFEIGPFVMSLWGQVNCHDNNGTLINVSNYYTPNHYAPGCVAVSMATLIHHYSWPITGIGSHTYSDNWGSSRGTYSADFENTYYSWNNMLTRYKNKASTDYQREAEGLLVYQSAIALDMDFEYNGSTSNVVRIPNAGDNYFRFSSVHRYEYSSVFWQLLDTNMFAEIPVILSVAGNGYGHSVICDGIRIESDSTYFYHLNMGWWGSTNGWYRIRDGFNAGGYSSVTGGVFNFVPIPELLSPVIDETAEIATLNWQYAPTCIADAYEVQQKIDAGNWETITDELSDTTIAVAINPSSTYIFRVRAKHKGSWSFSSWSEEKQMGYLGMNDGDYMEDIAFGPNPTNDIFNIYFPDNYSPIDIDIYNSIGIKIQSLNKQENINETTISTTNWISGMYTIRLSDGENNRVISIIKK